MTSSDAEDFKKWLQEFAAKSRGTTTKQIWDGCFSVPILFSDLSVSHCSDGLVICSLRIPARVTDEEGNWHAGAIAALIDNFVFMAVKTVIGHGQLASVDFSISYFSSAKINEEVEVNARAVEHRKNGKLRAVTVEVRNKGNGSLVALGRQWMASTVPRQQSNL